MVASPGAKPRAAGGFPASSRGPAPPRPSGGRASHPSASPGRPGRLSRRGAGRREPGEAVNMGALVGRLWRAAAERTSWLAMSAGAPRHAVLVLGLLGAALLVLGVALIVGLPIIMSSEVAKNVRIQPGSLFFNLWKEIPVPFYFSIYVFEVLNPNEVLKGMKPAVRQRGPYVYREFRDKINITFHKNDTVSFLEYRRFYFRPDLSNGTEEDYIVMPNILVLGGAAMMENLPPSVRIAVSTAFSFFKQKAFMNRTVGEYLWGYEDPLLKILNAIKPGLIPYTDKFGLFLDLNNTHMGRFTVNTGADDISKVQIVDNWNGLKKVSYWNSDQCNQINGSAGELWPPFVTPSSPIEFYSPDLCRSAKLEYKESGEFKGLPVYRYVLPKTFFANGTDYPPNEGFCPCRQSGILNVSTCRLNVPLFVSQPHFLNADPALLETVDGLHPNEQKHNFFVEMHPLTGAPLNASIKLQMNIFIKRVPLIIQTQKISPVVLPLLWFEDGGIVDEDILDQFYTVLVLIPSILGYVQYCAAGLGSVLLIITAFLWLKSKMDIRSKALLALDTQNSEPWDPATASLLQKTQNGN